MEKITTWFFNFLRKRPMYHPIVPMQLTFLGFFDNVMDKSSILCSNVLIEINFYYKLIRTNSIINQKKFLCLIRGINGKISDMNLWQASISSHSDFFFLKPKNKKAIFSKSTIFPLKIYYLQ